MPARRYYPAPACPECGKEGPGASQVKNTVYDGDGFILRHRACGWCEAKWWTKQQPETTIDPKKFRVVPPCDFREMTGRDEKRIYSVKPLRDSVII